MLGWKHRWGGEVSLREQGLCAGVTIPLAPPRSHPLAPLVIGKHRPGNDKNGKNDDSDLHSAAGGSGQVRCIAPSVECTLARSSNAFLIAMPDLSWPYPLRQHPHGRCDRP